MPDILFDKLAFKDHLTRSGIPEAQARAHADALHEALGEAVATKSDVALLRTELTAAIAQLETKLTIRMGAVGAAVVAILAGIKFFG